MLNSGGFEWEKIGFNFSYMILNNVIKYIQKIQN
jgi:hypothetical protein